MLFWGIKFIDKERAIGQADFPRDQLILYMGFFGIPSYVIWYATPWPDKPLDVRTDSEFTFFLSDGVSGKTSFEGEFTIKELVFDTSRKMYRIFAVSSVYNELSRKIGFGYWHISDEPVSGIKVIRQLVKNTLGEKFEVIGDENLGTVYKYTQFSYDTTYNALDIISKICRENMWEYYLTPSSICIGSSIYSTEFYAASHVPLKEHGKIWETEFLYSVTMEAYPAEPMSLFGDDRARVLWVKYNIGGTIDSLMTFIAQKPNKRGQYFPISERGFIQTLTGEAKRYGLHRFYRNYEQLPILIGKIHKDFTQENVNEYEAPIFDGDADDMSRDLKRRTFFKDSPNFPKLHLENLKMTTPYAGDGVGILFPQEESYRTLFTPNGEREMALIGPAYFGMGDKIPAKSDPKDFRLQLPDGAVIYNKNNNSLIITNPQKIDITIGSVDPTSNSPPASGSNILMDSSNIELSSPSSAASITISDGSIEIELGAGSIKVNPSDVQVINPTLKVSPGQVEIMGTLKVTGIVDATMIKGATVMNISGPMAKKIPPP